MKIAVCDDEAAVLKLVSSLVHSEFEKHGEKVSVSSYLRAPQLLRDIYEKKYDVVFLDIRMPEISGFDAAKEIRQASNETKIVFITTEEDLVFDSFDFQPFAFIPKHPPDIMKARLSRTTENLLSALKSSRKICIELPYNDKIYIKPDDLIYVNSDKNNLIYHLADGDEIVTRSKIPEAEELLPSDLFVRIHNRIIVNMRHVIYLEYNHTALTVTGGVELGISRTYKSAFDEAYDNFRRINS